MRKLPIYVSLFALYPVVVLYARLPGGAPIQTVWRTFLMQLLAAILPTSAPLAGRPEQTHWKVLYRDEIAVITRKGRP